MKKFFTSEDISAVLHISTRTLHNRLSLQAKLNNSLSEEDHNKAYLLAPPSFKIGKKRLYPVTQFDKWIGNFED